MVWRRSVRGSGGFRTHVSCPSPQPGSVRFAGPRHERRVGCRSHGCAAIRPVVYGDHRHAHSERIQRREYPAHGSGRGQSGSSPYAKSIQLSNTCASQYLLQPGEIPNGQILVIEFVSYSGHIQPAGLSPFIGMGIANKLNILTRFNAGTIDTSIVSQQTRLYVRTNNGVTAETCFKSGNGSLRCCRYVRLRISRESITRRLICGPPLPFPGPRCEGRRSPARPGIGLSLVSRLRA